MKKLMMTTAVSSLAIASRAGAFQAVLDDISDLPEDVQKEYVEVDGKFVLQVEGMKSMDDFNRLQNAHKKEKSDHSALKKRISDHFGDSKFEDIRKDLDRIPELEASTGDVDEEKINTIVEGRLKTQLAPVERERDELKGKLDEANSQIGDYESDKQRRIVHDAVREAATSAKVLPEAVDDALMLADRVFEVREDDGKVVVKDDTDYTAGIEPSVFFTDLQKKRPHWWGESRGGGSNGNRGGLKGGKNPWSHKDWNLTEQGRIHKDDPSKAEQLAKAAGHDKPLGVMRPEPATG